METYLRTNAPPLESLQQRADSGDVQACAKLGHIYTTGDTSLGIAPDRKVAASYYARGADQGDMACLFGLAGATLPDDPARAIDMLETCAENKYIWALATLGDFYLRGRHVEQDPQRAFAYLEEYNALCRPGRVPMNTFKVRWDLVLYPLCLLLGVGCEKNEAKARQILTELAAQGNLNAADILNTGKLNDWMAAKRFNFDTKKSGPVALFDANSKTTQRSGSFTHHHPRVHKPVREVIHQQRLSAFLQRALIPNEEVLMRGIFPRIYIVDSFLRLFFFIFLGRWVNHAMAAYPEEVYKLLPVMPLYNWLYAHPQVPIIAGACIGFFLFLLRMTEMWTTEIVLTSGRFIYKRGLFAIKMVQMNFWQIEHSNVTQSLLGSLLDYGSVEIQSYSIQAQETRGSSPGMLKLPNITHPFLFTRLIEDNRQLPYKMRGGLNPNNATIPMWVRH